MDHCIFCKDDITHEFTDVVSDVRDHVVVIQGVPSLLCKACEMRSFTSEVVGHLDKIRSAVILPGVEAATVDYAKIVAHLTETGVLQVEEPQPVAVAV